MLVWSQFFRIQFLMEVACLDEVVDGQLESRYQATVEGWSSVPCAINELINLYY